MYMPFFNYTYAEKYIHVFSCNHVHGVIAVGRTLQWQRGQYVVHFAISSEYGGSWRSGVISLMTALCFDEYIELLTEFLLICCHVDDNALEFLDDQEPLLLTWINLNLCVDK